LNLELTPLRASPFPELRGLLDLPRPKDKNFCDLDQVFFQFSPYGRGAADMSVKAKGYLYKQYKPAMIHKPLPPLPEGRNVTGPGFCSACPFSS